MQDISSEIWRTIPASLRRDKRRHKGLFVHHMLFPPALDGYSISVAIRNWEGVLATESVAALLQLPERT